MTTQVANNMIAFDGGAMAFRNKIINGCAWIDQRNNNNNNNNNNSPITVDNTGNNFAANSWQAGMYYNVAGAQAVIDTVGAAFAITDVQLELGSAATPFENRPIADELARCQRYFEWGYEPLFYIEALSRANAYGEVRYSVSKRAATHTVTASNWQYYSGGGGTAFTPTLSAINPDRFTFTGTALTNFDGWTGAGTWKADAEL